jgi:hypothetical protein
MRHLGSLLLSLVCAAAIYVLAGIGTVKAADVHGDTGTDWAATAITFGALIAAGLLYLMLMVTRLSPLGTVAAGLVLLGVTLWAMFWTDSFTGTMPADIGSIEDAGVIAAGPLTAILAIPLLCTLFSRRRWQRYDFSEPALVDDPYPGSAVSSFPNYSPPATIKPEYPPPSSAAPTYPEYTPPADPYAVYTPPSQPSFSGDEPTEAGQTAPPSMPSSQLPPDPSKPY